MIVGKILSAEEFKAQYKVVTKGVRESAYTDLKTQLDQLAVGDVLPITITDLVAGLGKALPKHFKANMRKRLKDWYPAEKGVAIEMVEAAAEGDKPTAFAFMRTK